MADIGMKLVNNKITYKDSDNIRLNRITKLLLKNREDGLNFWEWLSNLNGKPLDKKSANKFFFCCILDYQMKADTVWRNGKRFTEIILGDPDDLWGYITNFSHDKWMSKFKEFSLHRFPKAHERIWRIGNIIISKYGGDTRNIWKDRTPAEIIYRLYDMKMGEQISNMVVGALIDTKQIDGHGDLKADININRVLGRVIRGEEYTAHESIEMARRMYSDNPWLLDRELFIIGRELCLLQECYCDECYLRPECEYTKTLTPNE
jgi:hypothetical protein